MYCSNCGKPLPDGSRACPYCGAPSGGFAPFTAYQPNITEDNIPDEWKKGAEKIHVGKTMMRLGAFFLNDEVRHVSKIAKGIHSVLVLDLDHCSADAKRRFAAAVGSLNDNAYTTVMETNDGDDHVRILGKPDGADLRDVVIISYDRDDCQLVRLKGKVRGKDVRKLIDD